MIALALFLAITIAPDTSRCTWEGRLPDRGEYKAVVPRPSEVTRLTTIYRNGGKNERLLAIESLGKLGDPTALPVLKEAAAESNKHIVQAAVWALGRLNDARTVPFLLNALHSSNEQVQQAAACGLGRNGGTESLPALRGLVDSRNVFVASAARWSISRIEEIPVLPARSNY